MNIDALFPSAVPTDGQFAPEINVLSSDSAETGVFSLILATETEKIVPLPNADFQSNIESVPLVGMTSPAEQQSDEAPDATVPTKNPDRRDGENYLLLLPFFAFPANDPLWQNLPKRGNPAGQTNLATIATNATSTDSNCIEDLFAGPAMAAASLNVAGQHRTVEQQASPTVIETGAPVTLSHEELNSTEVIPTQVGTETELARQNQATNLKDGKEEIDPISKDPAAEQASESISSRSSEHPGQNPQPVEKALAQSSESEPGG